MARSSTHPQTRPESAKRLRGGVSKPPARAPSRAANGSRRKRSAATEGGTEPKRVLWAPEEDEKLRQLVRVHGEKSWAVVATEMASRSGKQCRERWRNQLRPLNKGAWTAEEDAEVWTRVQEMGTRWAQAQLRFLSP